CVARAPPQPPGLVPARPAAPPPAPLPKEPAPAPPPPYPPPHGRTVGPPPPRRPLEPHLQKTVRRQRPGIVAIDERLLVDVVHDEIDRTVAVQVAVGGPARKTRRVDAPGRARVCERRVAPVAKRVVRQLGRGHGVDEPLEIHARAARGVDHRLAVPEKSDVI